jgi:eukaryotic-like serine/threonine-protein kinase
MTAPGQNENASGQSSPMTPERWREVNTVLRGALSCEPERRDAFVAHACGEDQALRREVASLLAAHGRADDDFLERPPAEAFEGAGAATPLATRLVNALADRYEIERELARGGMATLYLARDLRHDRRVAIKVLRDELAAAVGADRFLEEIRLTASLQHPNILPLFDSGSADGLLWYVMPFVEGETLRSRLAREGRLPVDAALQLAREMADALEYAHRHGVVHRDVKPENVLLQSGHALVADFGIALALERAGGERLTRTGITLGTPQYMAPEQAAGERVVDARTDVYALGAVLHEMIAGEAPFAAESKQAVLMRVLHEPVVALSTRRPDVPPFLDAAVRRALAKQPDERFPSAAAFAEALAVPLRGDTKPEPGASKRLVSARAALYAAAAMVAIGLVGGWALARSSLLERWAGAASGAVSATLDAGGTVGPAAWAPATTENISLSVVDRAGRTQRTIAANRPWTPRFSPNGRLVAYGAFGKGRSTSDLWVTALDGGTTRRLTDDANDNNDPQWSADGATVAYSASAPDGKDLLKQKIGGGEPSVLAIREGTQFASDWVRDGSALLVTEQTEHNGHDILVQPVDGSKAWPYVATAADETAARISPDGRWVAYTSDESGRAEVYLDSYPRPRQRISISSGGGVHPVWRRDGRELYYWREDALVAVQLGAAGRVAPPTVMRQTVLFRTAYHIAPNTMYDVSPDGERFVIVHSPWTKP